MTPTFSIIIPTFRRPGVLTGCLDAMVAMNYPNDRFEVIVVNDGGEPLDEVVAPYQSRMALSLLTQPNAGPAAARNRGAAAARGRFLAFTDDDCKPQADWLTELETSLAAAPDVVVGGQVFNLLDRSSDMCSTASQLLVTYLYHYYNSDPNQARFFTSNNIAVARDAFVVVGGFNDHYHRAAAEDREFCDRWIHAGRRMIYAPAAIIHHAHRLQLSSFWRQHFQYGRGAFRYRQSRALRDAGPVRIEPFRFYTGLLSFPWTAGERLPVRLSMLLFVSQLANVLGFFAEKLSGGASPIAPSPLVAPGAAPVGPGGARGTW